MKTIGEARGRRSETHFTEFKAEGDQATTPLISSYLNPIENSKVPCDEILKHHVRARKPRMFLWNATIVAGIIHVKTRAEAEWYR